MAIIIGLMTTASALSFMLDSPGTGDQAASNSVVQAIAASSSVDLLSSSLDPVGVFNSVQDSQVPSKYVYMPNIFSPYLSGSSVTPLYTRSPAPMGIVDYGYMEPSGFILPYRYSTTSFMGTVMFEGISAMYPLTDNPESIAVQMSAVLNGVTVQGTAGHTFWAKNIMLYDPSTETAQLISNIWDFSTPSLNFDDNSLSSGNGQVLQSTFYYFAGPSLNLTGESTIALYLNSVTVNGSKGVQFQYSVSNKEGGGSNGTSQAVTFDTVIFNSGSSSGSGVPDVAEFEVNGYSKTPAGFLYDVEMVVTGPGSGSTTTIYGANGQLTLKFLSADGLYTKLPASYNYGSNTGETVQGLSVWWTSQMKPMAHLSLGPSLLVSMWGSQVSHSGAVNIQGTVDPANSFIFMSMGSSFDNETAAWAPISPNGSYKFSLPGRIDYSGVVMLSDFEPLYFTTATGEPQNESGDEGTGEPHGGQGGSGGEETAAWMNASLSVNTTEGIYTPLYATGNDQLKNLTVGFDSSGNITGNGTAVDPYMIENNMYAQISKLFWHTNYFLYPVFSGIMIKDTDARVNIVSPPNFYMKYQTDKFLLLSELSLPVSNSLGLMFVNTNGVNLLGADYASGWIPDIITGTVNAGVVFLNSTNYLVANNTFGDMGSSLLLYNDYTGNVQGTVWGNHFIRDYSLDSMYSPHMKYSTDPAAMMVYSSGNLIYNNYFALGLGVKSPLNGNFNPSQPSIYINSWNLSVKMPVDYVNTVNGVNLTGSIVDCGYQGGNYWDREIKAIPYDAEGGIAIGGDYYPLMPSTYNVTFNAIGLPNGIQWSVVLDQKYMSSSTENSMTLPLINGTHTFKVSRLSNYTVDRSYGAFQVAGATSDIDIIFSYVSYSITFMETGLPSGSDWSVNLVGEIQSSENNSMTFLRENGTYLYNISVPSGFYSPESSGTVLVLGSSIQVGADFSYALHRVMFMLQGASTPFMWNVTLGNTTLVTSASSVSIDLANGVYTYAASCPENYVITPSTGEIMVLDGNVTVTISATDATKAVQFHQSGMASGIQWSVEMGGVILSSIGSDIVFELTPGEYNYSVNVPGNFASSISYGNITVSTQDQAVILQFTKNLDTTGLGLLLGIGSAMGLAAGFAMGILLSRRE